MEVLYHGCSLLNLFLAPNDRTSIQPWNCLSVIKIIGKLNNIDLLHVLLINC